MCAAAELAAREQLAPTAAPPGPITLSYSALRTYRACPRRYQLQHASAPAGRARSAARAGQPAHDLAYDRRDPGQRRPRCDGALSRAGARPRTRSCWRRSWPPAARRALTTAQIDGVYRPRGERMLELYLRGVVSAGQVQRVYAELAVRQLMRDGPVPVYLVGRIDRVELDAAGWRMIDYKTHRALCPVDIEEAAVQLRLYKAAWQAGAAARVGRAARATRRSTSTRRPAAGCTRWWAIPAALDAAVNLLCDVAGKIAAGDFAVPPDYEPPCASCDYGGPYGLCPDRRNRRRPAIPTTRWPARSTARAATTTAPRRASTPCSAPTRWTRIRGRSPMPPASEPSTPTAGAPCFLCAPESTLRARLPERYAARGTARHARS